MKTQVAYGTCQVCQSSHRVMGGSIARHGWTSRKDWGGHHLGTCNGSGLPPFEVARDALILHVHAVSKNTEINPVELLAYITERTAQLVEWEVKPLTYVDQVAEAQARQEERQAKEEARKERVRVEREEAKKKEEARQLKLSEGAHFGSHRDFEEFVACDPYQLGDEGVTVEVRELKTGEQKLKAPSKGKLSVGDLVYIPARKVDRFFRLPFGTEINAVMPARVLEVSKGGLGLAWALVGEAVSDGAVDHEAQECLAPYRGYFQIG